MKDWALTPFGKGILKAHRVLLMWLLGDVAFAVIPIATIAIINKLLGDGFQNFLLIKEWSFATIVFFGVSIRRLIRLKVEIQQTPRSYKLDTGVQLYILLLIASVLVLSFVILGEKGVLARRESALLGEAQLWLFVLGMGSILMAVWAEDRHRVSARILPDGISKYWLLRRVLSSVDQAGDSLDEAVYAMERASTMKFAESEDQATRREEGGLDLTLHRSIERLERSLSESKRQLDSLKVSQLAAVSGKA